MADTQEYSLGIVVRGQYRNAEEADEAAVAFGRELITEHPELHTDYEAGATPSEDGKTIFDEETGDGS